ncbi:hypothetical protein L9F63_027314 [Diploptera punctata]|uniref:Ig-like domain-containing protein n=1 Tax=Diploptera punctata TaxID=6984 RepID=A0AAD8EM84_DIPPU|nr:hypothetical protein L9F63_027314 [Diploptera punctata]
MFTDPPQVTLQLGNTLNPDTIKENDDVYFECKIRANPKEHKITWLHNVSFQTYSVIFLAPFSTFMFLYENLPFIHNLR